MRHDRHAGHAGRGRRGDTGQPGPWARLAHLVSWGLPAQRARPARPARGGYGRGLRVRGRPDRGQVSIELLGMTPLIILTLVLMWQCVLVGYTFTLAGNAADEAVRAGTAAPPGGARQAACQAAGMAHLADAWKGDASVSCSSSGYVTADVSLKVPVLFPGVVSFPVTVHGHAGTVEEVKH